MGAERRTFTSQELSLLAAVHEDPCDDVPRLVYADWLEDQGDPEYAEFIRYQLATGGEMNAPRPSARTLERWLREAAPGDEAEGMRRRAALNLSAWGGPCPGGTRIVAFHRGLPIAAVPWWAGRHRRYGAILRAASPRQRFEVRLTEDAGQIAHDLRHPIFRRAHRLSVGSVGEVRIDPLDESRIATVAAWPGVGGVHRIELRGVAEGRMRSTRARFPRHVVVTCLPPTP